MDQTLEPINQILTQEYGYTLPEALLFAFVVAAVVVFIYAFVLPDSISGWLSQRKNVPTILQAIALTSFVLMGVKVFFDLVPGFAEHFVLVLHEHQADLVWVLVSVGIGLVLLIARLDAWRKKRAAASKKLDLSNRGTPENS